MNCIYFNELSLIDSKNSVKVEYTLNEVIKFLKNNDVNKCKAIDNVREFIKYHFSNKLIKSLALSYIVAPFNTSDEYEAKEDKEYILASWKYLNKEAIGLTYAYNTGTFTISFVNCGFDESIITINKEYNGKVEERKVKNISNTTNFDNIIEFINNNKPIVLVKSKWTIEEKLKMSRFASDNHHGTNILSKYMNKVLSSPYVDYIINSAVHESNNNNFISYDENKNALIIRLLFVDMHPGFVVKCTGRTKDECLKIKEILEKDLYDLL